MLFKKNVFYSITDLSATYECVSHAYAYAHVHEKIFVWMNEGLL